MFKDIELLGKTEAEARQVLKDFRYRIIRKDRSYYIVTCDLHYDRYNLEFDNGIVTKVYMG